MQTLEAALHEYFRVLECHGSPASRGLVGRDAAPDWSALSLPPDVTVFDDLKTWFSLIQGDEAESNLAWDMFPLSLSQSLEHHEMAGEYPGYWPGGFLPLLMDGAGSYLVVNCRASSPTFRAVYDMSEGVGCTRVANSLGEFIAASTQEVALGLRNYSAEDLPALSNREYLARAAPLFANSPYFARERMDQPVIDWEPGVVPMPNQRKSPRSAAAPPPSPEITRWAMIAGVAPPEDGSFLIKLSTAPVEHWYFQKSKLTPQTTTIEADIQRASWTAKLTREDRLFFVSWSPGGKIHVTSEQLKYQRLVRWPALDVIENFPALVKQLETLLGFKFIPYADVTVPYTEKQGTVASPQLQAWLAPCATKVGRYIGKA